VGVLPNQQIDYQTFSQPAKMMLAVQMRVQEERAVSVKVAQTDT